MTVHKSGVTSVHLHGSRRDDHDGVVDWWETDLSLPSPSSSSSASANQNYSISSWGLPKSAPRTDMTTDERRYKWRIEAEAETKKRENRKSVEGARGDKRKIFDPKYVSPDGKLHHGAFVLGARKSQECLFHNAKSEIQATNRCNFAHGWRGDTLQYVCTKCTDDDLTSCREKIKHEQFIWNLGPYYNSSGEIWEGLQTYDEVKESRLKRCLTKEWLSKIDD